MGKEKGQFKLLNILEHCISNSTLGVVIFTSDLRLKSITDKITDWFGYSREELMDKEVSKLAFSYIVEEDFKKALKSVKFLLDKDEKSICYNFRILAKDGSIQHTRWHTSVIEDSRGDLVSFISVVENFTDQYELENSQERLVEILESTPDFVGLAKADGNIMYINRLGQSMVGVERKRVAETRVSYYVPDDIYRRLQDEIFPFASKYGSWTGEFELLAQNGTRIPVSAVVNAHKDINGETEYYSAVCQDITAWMTVQNSLKQREERLELAREGGNIGFWDFYPHEKRIEFDNGWLPENLGYSDGHLGKNIKDWVDLIHPEELKTVVHEFRNCIQSKIPFFESVFRLRRKNGSWSWLFGRAKIIDTDDNGEPVRITGFYQDINDLKSYEEKIKQLIREKNVLLQEVHHRVKNNSALILAILQLQQFESQNVDANKLIQSCESRIKSIAMIHEILYQSNKLSRIDFSKYIRNLENLIGNTIQFDKKIKFSIECESFLININQAIPCALIINELIVNSLKHAFSEKRDGKIEIIVTLAENNITILVSDNGRGLKNDFEYLRGQTLGFTLINLLVKQLNADFHISTKNGVKARLIFSRRNISGSTSLLKNENLSI